MVNGKIESISLKTGDEEVARAKRDALESAKEQTEIERILGRNTSAFATIGEIGVAYIENGTGERYVRENNVRALKLVIRKASAPVEFDIDAMGVDELTGQLVQDFQDEIEQEIKAKRIEQAIDEETQARTKFSANRILSQARAIFSQERPLRGMRLPDLTGFRSGDMFSVKIETAFHPMSQVEVDLFGAESKKIRETRPKVYLTYLLMQWCGLRNEEIEFMKPAEWILRNKDAAGKDRAVINIKTYPYFTPKGVGSIRQVPLPQWILKEIDELAGKREWLLSETDPVETPKKSHRTERHNITHREINLWMRAVYAAALKEKALPAGTEVRTAYDFRKQAGSILYLQTHDLLAVQRFLGHESPTTTTKWYANLIKLLPEIAELRGR